jgi:hypothetical protein
LFIAAFAAGCGGGGSQKYPDATVPLDSSTPRVDAGVDNFVPPPVPGVGSQLVVPGSAFLVGSGSNSCTNQVPAPGDRWCAYAMPNASFGTVDLWVINASKAAAGTAINCAAGSDPNCLRLTTNLFVDPQFGIRVHSFDGDTLIYQAETGPTYDATNGFGFVGPVYGWRPGWAGARKLTSDSGVICQGHATVEAAICFENRDSTTVSGQTSYDLHAGPLPGDGGAPLPKVDTLLITADADVVGVKKFGYGFSPAGDYVAWSARPTATGLETLKVLKLGDPAPTMVAEDVTLWMVSPDSTRWYWLKSFNYDVNGATSGTLQMAPFPGGASPMTLAPAVGDFDRAGAKGLIFRDGLASGSGVLKLIADTDNPSVTTLDSGVLAVVDVSKDGTRAIYSRSMDPVFGEFDLYASTSVAGATPSHCTMAGMPTTPSLGTFLDTGSGALWVDLDPQTGAASGKFTDIASCATSTFAADIAPVWFPIAGEGYVYGDNSPDFSDMTLRYAKLSGAALPMGTSIQTHANLVFAPLLPALSAVVYTVNASSNVDGLYINASLPFTATTADGGM